MRVLLWLVAACAVLSLCHAAVHESVRRAHERIVSHTALQHHQHQTTMVGDGSSTATDVWAARVKHSLSREEAESFARELGFEMLGHAHHFRLDTLVLRKLDGMTDVEADRRLAAHPLIVWHMQQFAHRRHRPMLHGEDAEASSQVDADASLDDSSDASRRLLQQHLGSPHYRPGGAGAPHAGGRGGGRAGHRGPMRGGNRPFFHPLPGQVPPQHTQAIPSGANVNQNHPHNNAAPTLAKRSDPAACESSIVRSIGSYCEEEYWPSQWHLRGVNDAGVNVLQAWTRNYTGHGVTIAVVDDGLEWQHPDFDTRYSSTDSYDFNFNDGDPSPFTYDAHGTAAAGVAAAGVNHACGVGAAPNATIAGIRLIAQDTTDSQEAQALSFHYDSIDIYSASWGPTDDGRRLEGPGPLLSEAFFRGVTDGRNGLGVLYVWAGGNGRSRGDNCNYDGYANNRFTLTFGAIDHDNSQPYYSEDCAALIAAAPSSGSNSQFRISTTDLRGRAGDSSVDCMQTFGGTSASAPLSAGVLALVLEANRNLTWRDVIALLVLTSDKLNVGDPFVNAAGYTVSHRIGFGRINATLITRTAACWPDCTSVGLPSSPIVKGARLQFQDNEIAVHVAQDFSLDIPDTGLPVEAEIVVNEPNLIVESVDVLVWIAHAHRGEVEISLSGPAKNVDGQNTRSVLATVRGDDNANYVGWRFGSYRHWGEQANGTWKLLLRDGQLNAIGGRLTRCELIVYGHYPDGSLPPS